jgi:hypothetical protein
MRSNHSLKTLDEWIGKLGTGIMREFQTFQVDNMNCIAKITDSAHVPWFTRGCISSFPMSDRSFFPITSIVSESSFAPNTITLPPGSDAHWGQTKAINCSLNSTRNARGARGSSCEGNGRPRDTPKRPSARERRGTRPGPQRPPQLDSPEEVRGGPNARGTLSVGRIGRPAGNKAHFRLVGHHRPDIAIPRASGARRASIGSHAPGPQANSSFRKQGSAGQRAACSKA